MLAALADAIGRRGGSLSVAGRDPAGGLYAKAAVRIGGAVYSVQASVLIVEDEALVALLASAGATTRPLVRLAFVPELWRRPDAAEVAIDGLETELRAKLEEGARSSGLVGLARTHNDRWERLGVRGKKSHARWATRRDRVEVVEERAGEDPAPAQLSLPLRPRLFVV